MPSLGSDMETGTLVEWEKHPGDIIKRGDVVAVVETQKGAIEIEAYENGILESQLVDIGKQVPVGTPLAIIGTGVRTETARQAASDISVQIKADVAVQDELGKQANLRLQNDSAVLDNVAVPVDKDLKNEVAVSSSATVNHGRRTTPAARHYAKLAGIDIHTLKGTGPAGAVVLADILTVTQKRDDHVIEPLSDPLYEIVEPKQPMAAMRAAISAAMTRSKKEIPHYYLAHTVDLSVATSWLENTNRERDPSQRVLTGALFLKAVAVACAKYSEFNGYYENGTFQSSEKVHAGMAINLRGGGLVAPAIHDTNTMTIDQLMEKMHDLVQRVKAGRFKAAELSDPTITVSSLGERGVNSLLGVVYPPQVAIVGFGTPTLRPLVDANGHLYAGTAVDITLAADHRVSDGHRGALFLRFIQKQLENPEALAS